MIRIRRVVGDSMRPVLKPGMLVVTLRRRYYRPGKIVLANVHGREVIKRLHGIIDGQIILKGDNRRATTDYVTERRSLKGQMIYPRA